MIKVSNTKMKPIGERLRSSAGPYLMKIGELNEAKIRCKFRILLGNNSRISKTMKELLLKIYEYRPPNEEPPKLDVKKNHKAISELISGWLIVRDESNPEVFTLTADGFGVASLLSCEQLKRK